jgi:hypothetical protein
MTQMFGRGITTAIWVPTFTELAWTDPALSQHPVGWRSDLSVAQVIPCRLHLRLRRIVLRGQLLG